MIHIGIVGTGGMANSHAENFARIKGCKVVAGCDVDAERALAFCDRHGIPHAFTDVKAMLNNSRIDAISVVTPDASHAALTLKAIAAGKHVLCEKPLATNHSDALKMVRAAKKSGVINMVNFSYRNASAIQMAQRLIQDGRIGVPVHVEASYLQSWLSSKVWGDWRQTPGWLWRLSSAHGSRGVLGDVGVHILDFASYPVGALKSVQATLKTFSELKGKQLGDYTLDANDSCVMNVEFENGAIGTIHTTRWATGFTNSLSLAIFGSEGGIRINLDQSYTALQVCEGADIHRAAWKEIDCGKTPTIYERFIKSIRTGKNDQPDFARGAAIQKALDAGFTSHETGLRVAL